jgi:hypothetical protein
MRSLMGSLDTITPNLKIVISELIEGASDFFAKASKLQVINLARYLLG